MIRSGIVALVAIVVCGHPDFVWGQSGQCPTPDDTSSEAQQRARSLRDRAFETHQQLAFKKAADQYSEAAALWPLPQLYWQAGMAYAQAAELLLAYEHLSRALACGRGILDNDDYQAAEAQLKRLQPFFAQLEVQCQQPGLSVRVDGADWFVCPDGGTAAKREVVLVGPHQVEVRKAGHVDMNASLNLATGKLAVVEARLVPDAQAMIASRRWATWKPWAVVGGALALSAVGAGLDWSAYSRLDAYRAAVAADCDPGCRAEDTARELLRERDRVVLENRLAMGAFAVSGAALVTGLTLLYLNRSQRRPNPAAGRARVRMTGTLVRGAVGAALRLSF